MSLNQPKYLFHRDVLLSSMLTFVILFILKLVIFNIKFLNPVSQALGDFQFTDLYYSQFQKQHTDIDTNIVIVNIGENDRQALTQELQIIKSYEPKVIGLDVTFITQKEPNTDSLLKAELHGNIPIFLTSNILYENQQNGNAFSLERSHPFFEKQNDEGYGNFLAEEGYSVRYYAPFLKHEGNQIASLSAKIVEQFNLDAYEKLQYRNRKSEIINYRSNNFPKLDVSDIYGSADLSFLRDKIVLMGYMGPNFSQLVFDDNKLTPLNKSYGGHAIPDMYGVEVHANIISMILSGKYINEVPMWLTMIIAFCVCVMHMYTFIYLSLNHHKWYHFISKIIQLISFSLILFICLWIYDTFALKLEPAYVIVGVVLAGNALYFYRGFVQIAHIKFGFESLYTKDSKH